MTNLRNTPDVLCLMSHHAATKPDQEAVTLVRDVERDDAATLTYRQLDAEARRVAGWLQEQFRQGDRILLLYPVGLGFVVAFMGCVYAGMIAVPAPLPGQHRHERHRLRAIAKDAGISAIFTDQENLELVRNWTLEELGPTPCLATERLARTDGQDWKAPVINRQVVLLLQYTSGSTGAPKGVMITHNNLLHNVDSYRQALGFDEHTRFGGWIPLFHDMGLMAQLLPALFLGSSCVLMTPATFVTRPFAWLRMIDRYNVNYSAAPNFAFELCLRRVSDEQLARLNLSRWMFATNGSEPVQATTLTAFAERFAAAGFQREALCPCYGMAEATVYVSGKGRRGPLALNADAVALASRRFEPARGGHPSRELVSCGVPVGYTVRIVDPKTHEPLPAGCFGEIWLQGDSVSPGYWQNQAATNAAFRAVTSTGEGFFLRTGDLGLLHDGELYIGGRLKELVIAYGRNLYPQDIEYELRAQHPELASRLGAVFGVATDEGEAMIVSHEVRGLPDEISLRNLAQNIRATVLREFGTPVGGVVLLRQGSVMRTTSGKIQRNAMRSLFLSNALPVLHSNIAPHVQAVLASPAIKLQNGLSRADSGVSA